MPPEINNVKEHIAWSYANLARADAALREGVDRYKPLHHIIRAKLFRGLVSGTMSMRSLYDDERLKMTVPQACYYCGSVHRLSVDHLIPRIKDGPDEADNLIWACRACNSSKQGRDMLQWMQAKRMFPAVLLLRRYLKIVARYCEQAHLMEMGLREACTQNLQFDLALLPYEYPALTNMTRWVYPQHAPESSHHATGGDAVRPTNTGALQTGSKEMSPACQGPGAIGLGAE